MTRKPEEPDDDRDRAAERLRDHMLGRFPPGTFPPPEDEEPGDEQTPEENEPTKD